LKKAKVSIYVPYLNKIIYMRATLLFIFKLIFIIKEDACK